jgi:hypothetical protein
MEETLAVPQSPLEYLLKRVEVVRRSGPCGWLVHDAVEPVTDVHQDYREQPPGREDPGIQ